MNTATQQNALALPAAAVDPLTGLAHRRAFLQFLAEQVAAAGQHHRPLSLLLVDVDKLRDISYRQGHAAGDEVLRRLGRVLAAVARPQDLAGRWSGGACALVLTDTPRPAAAAVAESLRRAFAAEPLECGAARVPVTLSVGVCGFDPRRPAPDPARLVEAAELAVYAAKAAGRNCVRVSTLNRPVAAASNSPSPTPPRPNTGAAA